MSDRITYIERLGTARTEMRKIVKVAQGNPTIYQPWRMKEVLDHITGWDDAVIASIKSLLAGEFPQHLLPEVSIFTMRRLSHHEKLSLMR